ncbi:transcriptional regulator, putative [Listeria monocytogenes FSL F2-208]|nr:transcriptional regulator, putative [Listeria monocytogenes FSL F2-208]
MMQVHIARKLIYYYTSGYFNNERTFVLLILENEGILAEILNCNIQGLHRIENERKEFYK